MVLCNKTNVLLVAALRRGVGSEAEVAGHT